MQSWGNREPWNGSTVVMPRARRHASPTDRGDRDVRVVPTMVSSDRRTVTPVEAEKTVTPTEAVTARSEIHVRDDTSIVSAFSVDVEDYFHDESFREWVPKGEWDALDQRVEVSTRRLMAILDDVDVTATFFVLGWVAERNPALVLDLQRSGHELAIHGYDHKPITAMTRDEFREDIRRSKGIVEDITGQPVLGYRAPTFSVTRETMWALDILTEEDIRYDASIFPIVHDRYGIPDAERFPYVDVSGEGRSIIEFPMSTVRVGGRNLPFIGGGYLRHFPMRYVRWGVKRVLEMDKRPMVLYVHPWEIDPEHPVLETTRLGKLRHYRGLDRLEGRLREVLEMTRFDTMRKVLGI